MVGRKNPMNKERVNRLRDYIKTNLTSTLREANDYLKYPFIDPGSVYDGNLWDWDSFWTVYALFNLLEELPLSVQEKILLHAKGNIYNFFDNQLEDGYIPMMIEKSEWDEPYLNIKHKEGLIMNMCKPFLCQQITIISDKVKDYEWIRPFKEQILKYFTCYDTYYFNKRTGLYVWADDIMIGMDNDPASFGRPKFSTANIFLNSFMVCELEATIKIFEMLEDKQNVMLFTKKKLDLVGAIQRECWDKRDKFYYSVDVDIETRTFDWFHKGLGVFWNTLPIKIRVWSGFIPLIAGIADEDQAKFLVEHILDEETFWSPSGVTSLAMDEKMYNLEATNNPSNWLGPVWGVVQYVVFKGLMNYGYEREARMLCDRVTKLFEKDLEETGTLHEYYNPQTGEPVMNGGFFNWNMLILNMIDELGGKRGVSYERSTRKS